MRNQQTIGNFNLTKIGVLDIPGDFSWAEWLMEFIKFNRHRTHFDIDTSNVIEPSDLPKPGSKIHVNVVNQIIDETKTLERIDFLKSQKHLVLGTLGAALCLDQLLEEIPAGKDIYSFDRPQNLREKRLSKIYKGTSEVSFFYFEEGYFVTDGRWSKESLFFQFNYVEKPHDLIANEGSRDQIVYGRW